MRFKRFLRLVMPVVLIFSIPVHGKEDVKPGIAGSSKVQVVSGKLVNLKDVKARGQMSKREKDAKIQGHCSSHTTQTTVAISSGSLGNGKGATNGGSCNSRPAPLHASITEGSYAGYYIQVINNSIGIYNTETGELAKELFTFDSFFPPESGSPCANTNLGSPFVLYDRYNDRWFLMNMAWNESENVSFFSIAVSRGSDPLGEWWTYCLQADTDNPEFAIDSPRCGLWHGGIYIAANMCSEPNNPGSYQYTRVWALKTPDVYNEELIVLSTMTVDASAKSLLPGNAGSPEAPPGVPNYMFSMDSDEFGSQVVLYRWACEVNWNSEDICLDGPYELGCPQPETATTLASQYDRLMYPANYWNFGDKESVVLCHACEYEGQQAIRWYELQRPPDNDFHIYQQGTFSIESAHCWMGSIAINGNGDIAMGFGVSSSSPDQSFAPYIGYCSRKASDDLGIMTSVEVLKNWEGFQGFYDEWGECSSICVSPGDNATFWYSNQYYTEQCENWQTWVASFIVD